VPLVLNETYTREQTTYRLLKPLGFNVTNITAVLAFARGGEVLLATMSMRPGVGLDNC
jgi:hypothetical protein